MITYKLTRDEVEHIVDTERAHQNVLLGHKASAEPITVCGALVLMDRYIRKAIDEWTDQVADHGFDQLRKIAAIAVRCLENYGNLGVGMSREEAFSRIYDNRPALDHEVNDQAEVWARLYTKTLDAMTMAVDQDPPATLIGHILEIAALSMAAMQIHGVPARTTT